MFFTSNRLFLHVHAQHTRVSVLILHPREMQALWSQKRRLHCNAVRGADNAMPCRRTVCNKHNICTIADQVYWICFFLFSISVRTSFVSCSFSCGYYAVSSFGFCCDSFSIWYVSWYVTLISPFYFCRRYTICFSYCVTTAVQFMTLICRVQVGQIHTWYVWSAV